MVNISGCEGEQLVWGGWGDHGVVGFIEDVGLLNFLFSSLTFGLFLSFCSLSLSLSLSLSAGHFLNISTLRDNALFDHILSTIYLTV